MLEVVARVHLAAEVHLLAQSAELLIRIHIDLPIATLQSSSLEITAIITEVFITITITMVDTTTWEPRLQESLSPQ